MFNESNGAVLRRNSNDADEAPRFSKYFDMPALKRYMASEQFQHARQIERAVCVTAVVDDAMLEGEAA